MNIADVLRIKFPEADLSRDIVVQDDGDGPYIKSWGLGRRLKPSKQTLEEWLVDPEILEQFNKEHNDVINKPIYDELEKIDRRSIRPLRNKDTMQLSMLEAEALELRKKLKR